MPTVFPAMMTADELYAIPDGEWYELIDGQLVERTVSQEAAHLITRCSYAIQRYLESHPLEDLFSESAGYRCFFFDGHRVRKTDLSLI